ncbi:MAG: carotenoid biosynthesis protein, partial [Rhabdochlamydiaceae bacterium]
YWVWTGQFFPLPKLDGIPLTNFVGWFILVTLMVSIYLVVSSKNKYEIKLRHNTSDSQLAYFFLIVDGTIANWTLGNVSIIAIGLSAMFAFLAISFFYSKKNRPKIKSSAQVIE